MAQLFYQVSMDAQDPAPLLGLSALLAALILVGTIVGSMVLSARPRLIDRLAQDLDDLIALNRAGR
jgi:hypothetical protein